MPRTPICAAAVGVGLTALILFRAFFNIRKQLSDETAFATLRLCFLSAAVLSNYTEASFYGISNIWIILLLALVDIPRREAPLAEAGRLRHA